jgi:hypothetical protein
MPPDFDALALAANAQATPTAMERLWDAVFALPAWHLAGRRQGAGLRPLVTRFEDQDFVLAFTDEERARAFLAEQGLAAGPEGAELLSLTVEEATDYLDELGASGPAGVVFNEGTGPFAAPLAYLVRMYARHRLRGNDPS